MKPTRSNRFEFTKAECFARAAERPASGETWWFDTHTPGLALRVPAQGEPRFALYAWIKGGVKKRNLGALVEGGMSVDRARKEAVKERAAIEEGRDEAQKPAASAGPEVPTLRVVFARYVREVRGKKRTWREDVDRFRKHVKPDARVPITQVDADWLRSLHRRITSRGTKGAADKVVALLSAVLTFHLGEGAPNPAQSVRRNGTRKRHRRFTDAELSAILSAIDQYEAEPARVSGSMPLDPEVRERRRAAAQEVRRTAADVLRVAYWSGQRIANVCAMKWEDVDLAGGTYTIADDEFKTGEPHVCALPDEALAVLRRRASNRANAKFVFPAGNAKSRSGHFSNYHNAWNRVLELAGIDHRDGTWVHDLRANLATRMAKGGENAFTIQRQLGHRKIETTLRYVRLDPEDVRAAVERTARSIRAAVEVAK
jgi:integrase